MQRLLGRASAAWMKNLCRELFRYLVFGLQRARLIGRLRTWRWMQRRWASGAPMLSAAACLAALGAASRAIVPRARGQPCWGVNGPQTRAARQCGLRASQIVAARGARETGELRKFLRARARGRQHEDPISFVREDGLPGPCQPTGLFILVLAWTWLILVLAWTC